MYTIVNEEQTSALGHRTIALTSITLQKHFRREVDFVWEQMEQNITWIGPLRTQYATNLSSVIDLLEHEKEVLFTMNEEEYQIAYEDDSTCLVMGRYYVTADEDSGIFLRCLERVSFLYKLIDDRLKIVHMHLSHPYEVLEQDEFFPFRFGREAYDYIAQTYQLAFLDSLTGIGNRNAYETDLMMLSERLTTHKSIAIAIFDLNNLKLINDSLGHLAGDQLIHGFARLLRNAMPPGVKVYRYGGDEFAAFFQDVTRAHIESALERLEHLKEAYNAVNAIRITFASGFAFFNQKTDPNLSEMIRRADAMLYENKRNMKKLIEPYS